MAIQEAQHHFINVKQVIWQELMLKAVQALKFWED
jgi:hypothetical protein